MSGTLKNGEIRSQNVPQRSQNSNISKNPNNMIFQHISSSLSSTFTFFRYLLILTPPSYVLGPYFAVFQSSTQFWAWSTSLGHNWWWKSKFGSIDVLYCNFQILLSSGLLVTFLVLEFKLKSFSNLLGPNDPKKGKKSKNVMLLCIWPLIWPFWPLLVFEIFLGILDVK